MIKLICGLLSLILLICAIAGEIHMDCENPPAVEFASVEVVDNEDNVGAIYKCANGYELQGPLELLCDLDTDEWNTDPPICVPLNEVDNDGHEDDDDAANEIEPEPKRKRKQQHVVEDTQVPVEMASSLDMSCGQENITAPQVSNGYVKKYERRRRAQHIFLVAIYACNQNYEIEEHEVLYCSERRWIGNLPVCTSLNDDEEYEEYEEEDEKVTANEEDRVSQPELIDAKTDEADEDADEYKDEEESEHEEQVTEKAIATEDVKSTQDPYEPRLLDRDCGDTNGGCSQTCERVVFPGENEPRLKCGCYEGFSLDPYDYSSCHDIDECQINNGGCGQICNNTPGSFHCSCEQGLQIDGPNGKTCIDINECESPEVEQECGGACENTQGSYRCLPVLNTRVEPIVETLQCAEGFELNADGTECLDVDECAAETHECSHECLNTSGGYECSCPGGYRLSLNNKYACEDIDECLAEPQICGELTCTNFPGSYACKCADGSEPNAETGLCASEVLEPVCEAGFVLSANGQSCEDVDECQLANGGCEHICSNNKGSYTCDCPEGYQLQPDQRTCLDIDECSTNRHNCTHECLNTDGSYACACPTGYYLHDDKLSCLDVDECQSGAHACSHECLNAVGSYGCICPAGFELTADERTCQLKAVDRCALQNGGCSHFCDNELGCSCPPGHKLASDNSSCIDVDECAISNGGCSHECLNREGGYDCRCPKGYELSAENPWSCVDINECLTPHICQHECHNSNGSYSCSCPFGYELRNERYCADIDECAVANGGCVGGECINHNGGHECRCAVGQRLAWDRRTCEARTDLRDACPPFKAPANGFIHCTKYRHKQQLFYKTKCEVGCNAGYRLEGASRRFCNSSGLWDQQKSVCTRVFCGGLPAPRYGRLMPFFCNSPMVVANTVCRLECWPGTYRPVGAAQSVCTEQGVWSHNRTMDCHNSYHHTRHRVNQVFQPRTISSSDGGFSIWGQSQAVPNTPPRSKLGKIESPIIVFCTPSFTVNLRPNQVTRSITWKEPRFKSATLMKVNRSKIPGSLFGIGEHRIMYEATNADNIKSRCEFNIIVRAAASTPAPILPAMNLDFTDNGIMTRRGPLVSNSALIEPKLVTAQLLAGHEAYVICPGKMPYKVKSAQVNFPVNCQLKSVRTNSHTTQHRLLQRRLFTSQQWMPFTNY